MEVEPRPAGRHAPGNHDGQTPVAVLPTFAPMNFLPRLRFSALLVSVALLAGCSTSPISRIDANRAVYESWPIEMQEAVSSGRAAVGMTPEMVEMALGKPSEVNSREGKDGPEEVWVYKKSSSMPSLLGNTGISLGGSIGPIGIGTGGPARRANPASTDEQDVVFKNGVVIRADPAP